MPMSTDALLNMGACDYSSALPDLNWLKLTLCRSLRFYFFFKRFCFFALILAAKLNLWTADLLVFCKNSFCASVHQGKHSFGNLGLVFKKKGWDGKSVIKAVVGSLILVDG